MERGAAFRDLTPDNRQPTADGRRPTTMIIPNHNYTARERSVCEILAPLANVRRMLNVGIGHARDPRKGWWIGICKANGTETHTLEVFEPKCRELRDTGIENVTCRAVRDVARLYDEPFDAVLWWHGPQTLEKAEAAAVIDELRNRTTFGYDGSGNQVTRQNPLGKTWTTIYDCLSRVKATLDPLAHRTSLGYDAASRQVTATSPLGLVTTSVYDAASRLTASLDPLANRSSFVYDAASQRIAVVDPLARRTTTVYDAAGRVKATVDALAARTTLGLRRGLAKDHAQGRLEPGHHDALRRRGARARDCRCPREPQHVRLRRRLAAGQREEPHRGCPHNRLRRRLPSAGNRGCRRESNHPWLRCRFAASYCQEPTG